MTPYGARYQAPTGTTAKARARALRAIRGFGLVTAGLRTLPDYLVIGAKRGGTTSLARWLLKHPEVRPLFPARETRKGTYYFDVNYNRGQRWYQSHFPTRMAHRWAGQRQQKSLLVGEATPYYLYHPHAPLRARRLVPDAKVIALLRNPVDRTRGHWAERFRQGVETLSFEDALAAEPERLAGEEQRMLDDPSYVSFAHQHFSYVDQSRYGRGLARWLAAYPSQQVLVLRSEDLYADPSGTYNQVLDFLGLRSYQPNDLVGWNRSASSPLDASLRFDLQEQFQDDIAVVEQLLDRSMDWE